MGKIRIGIQGDIGSTNERACKYFAEKHGWDNLEIKYLISTENVLKALKNKDIDYGTFAWKSSKAGLVSETQEAIKKYEYKKIDSNDFFPDHVVYSAGNIDKNKQINIYSHKQALLEHKPFLDSQFPDIQYNEEIDTGIAAKKLAQSSYGENSLVIAPINCGELFGLNTYISDLPTNKGYFTTLYLVTS